LFLGHRVRREGAELHRGSQPCFSLRKFSAKLSAFSAHSASYQKLMNIDFKGNKFNVVVLSKEN